MCISNNIQNISGEDIDVVTPVPIPNTEVKHIRADDSLGSPPAKIGICQIFFMPKNKPTKVLFFILKIPPTDRDAPSRYVFLASDREVP